RVPDHRPVGDREDHHHVHPAERLAARAGRLHRAHAGRQGLRLGERLLRQDLLARSRLRAEHLQGGHQPGLVPGERVPDDQRHVNFFETSYTKNGRSVFSLSDLGAFMDAAEIPAADYLLILNWNENIVPAVSRLTQAQAAGYFMLGETTGTSAGAKAEQGKLHR